MCSSDLIDIEESGESWVDLHIVEIIVTNLLSNALKFTEINGNIHFAGHKKADSYVVKVSNSGKQLSSEQLSKLFERYYTDGPSHYSSTGIGLSLVKELCTLYGANLSVAYNDKRDIEFTVVFPPLQKSEQVNVDRDKALDLANVEKYQPQNYHN